MSFIKGQRVRWTNRGTATVVSANSPDGLVMIRLDSDGKLWRVSETELTKTQEPEHTQRVPIRHDAKLGLFGILVDTSRRGW
jgi:hypothetical protein